MKQRSYRGFTIRAGYLLGDPEDLVYFVYNAEGRQMFDYHECISDAKAAIDEYLG